MSIFDENSVNVSQFVQLTETFLGDEPSTKGFETLMKYIKSEYQETEEEKMERLVRVSPSVCTMLMLYHGFQKLLGV
jgi:hypothetical protein